GDAGTGDGSGQSTGAGGKGVACVRLEGGGAGIGVGAGEVEDFSAIGGVFLKCAGTADDPGVGPIGIDLDLERSAAGDGYAGACEPADAVTDADAKCPGGDGGRTSVGIVAGEGEGVVDGDIFDDDTARAGEGFVDVDAVAALG